MASIVRQMKRRRERQEARAEMAWFDAGKPYTPADPEGKALARMIIDMNPSGFVQCFHCGLVLDLWELLVPGFSEWCTCGAPWFLDGHDWGMVRKYRPDLPEVPESGKIYSTWNE